MPFQSKIMLRWHQEKASLTSAALKIKLLFDISTPVVHSKPSPPRLVALVESNFRWRSLKNQAFI